jgi:bifunctional ADP-heptose synthase (sugar kinase/adenylyltransferase)
MVVGDLMLDKYLWGSPEAPVPVLLREAEWAVLGGRPMSALTSRHSGPKSSWSG